LERKKGDSWQLKYIYIEEEKKRNFADGRERYTLYTVAKKNLRGLINKKPCTHSKSFFKVLFGSMRSSCDKLYFSL